MTGQEMSNFLMGPAKGRDKKKYLFLRMDLLNQLNQPNELNQL
jgi:hypothetical protein